MEATTESGGLTARKFTTAWGQGAVILKDGLLATVILPVLGFAESRVVGAPWPEVPWVEERKVEWLDHGVSPVHDKWVREVEEYFRGERLAWRPEDIPLHEVARTQFARDVFRALLQVPPGKTITYGELAERAGHPGAARAVGNLMASNPLPLVIPCHRVIRADGSLGQYGKDARWKALLLAHERLHSADQNTHKRFSKRNG